MLAWELSNSLDTSFRLLAFERACQIRKPQVVNTDQGAQYTSLVFGEQVTGAGMAVLMAFCGSALNRSLRGGLAIVGQLNLGGSLDPIYNAVSIAEPAVEKGASILLMPLNSRRQLNDLSDELITKINIQFYSDAKDCLTKSLLD